MAIAAPLEAAGSEDMTRGYALTAWTAATGLPEGDILAMAQDSQGYLWLGMTGGLVRFDGFEFVRWGDRGEPSLPGTDVPALVGARDGSLWVAFGDSGGVSRIRAGRVTSYSSSDGLPPGPVRAVLEDRQRTIWVGGRGGLSAGRDGRWQKIGREQGLPEVDVTRLYEDEGGAIWVGTAVGVYRRAPGGERFELRDEQSLYVQDFVESGDGTIWVTDSQEIVRPLDHRLAPEYAAPIRLPTAGWRMVRDHRGVIWVAALGGGLLRLREEGPEGAVTLDRFSYEHKIVGSPRSVFEDREQSIWVGMRGGGLLRVSEGLPTADVPLEGLTNDGVRALTVDRDRAIWVATGHNLHRFIDGRRQVYDVAQTLALHAARNGDLWIATAQTLGRFRDGRLIPVPIPSRVRLERITSLTTDASGGLWLCSNQQGLFRWHEGELTTFDGVTGVGARPCNSLRTDRHGRVWAGFGAGGGVAVYENGAFHVYAETHGLARGSVVAIYEDRHGGLWVSTTTGVTRFEEGRFTTVTVDNGLPGRFVPLIVQDEGGYLWLGVNSGSAIVRLSEDEVDAVAADPNHQVSYTLYDLSDGLQGELHWWSRPAAVLGDGGQFWFVTSNGMAVLDPSRLPDNRYPVPARIDRVLVDGEAVPLEALEMLPADTTSLEIAYGALSLSAASKVRFRYQLEGLSSHWVDAGSRRRVTYTDLPPGRYFFRVKATNYGGGLSESEATWSFSIPPPIYRRAWFFALIALILGTTVWFGWWMRLRAVRHQFGLVAAERARVSREIHDTLLQSLGAIGLELEAIAGRLGDVDAHTKQALRRLRKRVVRCVREARTSIWELRSPGLDLQAFVPALRELADRLGSRGTPRVDVVVTGQPRPGPPQTERELLRIAQEALSNAIRHGRPSNVHIEAEYRDQSLVLRIADDGIGFVWPNGEKGFAGPHLGLVNMQERAAEAGGRLVVDSQPGHGTVVEVQAPLPPS